MIGPFLDANLRTQLVRSGVVVVTAIGTCVLHDRHYAVDLKALGELVR